MLPHQTSQPPSVHARKHHSPAYNAAVYMRRQTTAALLWRGRTPLRPVSSCLSVDFSFFPLCSESQVKGVLCGKHDLSACQDPIYLFLSTETLMLSGPLSPQSTPLAPSFQHTARHDKMLHSDSHKPRAAKQNRTLCFSVGVHRGVLVRSGLALHSRAA